MSEEMNLKRKMFHLKAEGQASHVYILWRHPLFRSCIAVNLMLGMATASLPWQPRCAVFIGTGDSEILSNNAFGSLCKVPIICVRF
jgi:hypothetical protein